MFVPNNMEERLRHVHVNGKKESVHNMMDLMEISFPNLGIDLKYVPKGFTVFGFTIAIYGICIAVAVICGYLMAAKVAKKTGQNPDTYFDFCNLCGNPFHYWSTNLLCDLSVGLL